MKIAGRERSPDRTGGGEEDRRPSLTVIFKGLDKCNSDCTYCSVGQAGGRVIDPRDFDLIAGQLERLVVSWGIHSLTFTFHGGEPTLLDPGFLEEVCRRVEAMAPVVRFNMQSNLISLPPAVLEVAERHRIRIGTSVDPLGIDRVDRRGRNLFWPWLRNYLTLARRGNPPGAIYVVTKHSLGRAEAIYNACEAIGNLTGERFSLQVNHVYAQGKAGEPESDLMPSPEAFGDFLVELWRLWEERGRTIAIGPIGVFSEYFRRDRDQPPEGLLCAFAGDCSRSHVGIDLDLNVAGCGRRLDSKAFIGNLKEDPLEEILVRSEEWLAISRRPDALRGREPCSACEFFILCHGGCPDDASLGSEGLSGRFPLCEGYRKLFNAMAEHLQELSRPPERVEMRARRKGERPPLFAARRVDDLPREPHLDGTVWMLPDAQGGWLAFDSGLDRVLQEIGPRRVRLWIHNAQVPSMMLWEDLIRRPGVEVGLFEGEGLERALNILNAMGASIALDPLSIASGEEGFGRLGAALDRLTGDPQWQSRVGPFSNMIQTVVENGRARFTDRFGLEPGGHRLVSCDGGVPPSDAADRLVAGLRGMLEADAASWLEGRRACLACTYLRPCGSALATDAERGCPPASLRLVERVASVAERMRRLLPRVQPER